MLDVNIKFECFILFIYLFIFHQCCEKSKIHLFHQNTSLFFFFFCVCVCVFWALNAHEIIVGDEQFNLLQIYLGRVGSLVVMMLDFGPEGPGSISDATRDPPCGVNAYKIRSFESPDVGR